MGGMNRTCKDCAVTKPLWDFEYQDQKRTDQSVRRYYAYRCKDCERSRRRPIERARHRDSYERVRANRKYRRSLNGHARLYANHIRGICRKRGLAYDLDYEWFLTRLEKGCELTGLPFVRTGDNRRRSPSVDRVNPEGGYTKSNCRLVLNCVNMLRLNGGDAEMAQVARHLAKDDRPALVPAGMALDDQEWF